MPLPRQFYRSLFPAQMKFSSTRILIPCGKLQFVVRNVNDTARGIIPFCLPHHPSATIFPIPFKLKVQEHDNLPKTKYSLSRGVLLSGLQLMAQHLHSQNLSLTLIAVGGAVNVIHLQTRATTHDVDFLGSNTYWRALSAASSYTQRHCPQPLHSAWINNATVFYQSERVHCDVITLALAQDVEVFSSPGLRVLAAPWSFAFTGKTNCMDGRTPDGRPYDRWDAAAYLREYLVGEGRETVGEEELMGWGPRWERLVTVRGLRIINVAYSEKYGVDGIRFRDSVR